MLFYCSTVAWRMRMEFGVIGVVIVVRVVHRRTAEEEDVVSFNFKIDVLETDFFYVGTAETRAPILNFALQMRFSMLY